MSSNAYDDENEFSYSAKWVMFLVVMALVVLITFYKFYPMFVNMETEGYRQTQQYRTSKETVLMEKYGQWVELDTKATQYRNDPETVKGFRAQQAVLLSQLKSEAGRIQPDQVPSEIARFLASH